MPSDDEIRAICADPAVSHWLRIALTSALDRDPVDAANDAGLLSIVLDRRATERLASGLTSILIDKARQDGPGAGRG